MGFLSLELANHDIAGESRKSHPMQQPHRGHPQLEFLTAGGGNE
jgi:hypothetical protein